MSRALAFLTLSLALGPSHRAAAALLSEFPDPQAVFALSPERLCARVPALTERAARAILNPATGERARRVAADCEEKQIRLLTPGDGEFPARFRTLSCPPLALFCRGLALPDSEELAVGVVGTRHMDAYGERMTYRLSFDLARAGVQIISGMAAGVDGVAAAAALHAGGHTVAVLGCGVDVVYPRRHAGLMEAIAERGTLLSESPPGAFPARQNFPVRNRLISALSGGVLVTQAGIPSGALITAKYALAQGRPLFAVPGSVDAPLSAGANQLIRGGAVPVFSAFDLLIRLPGGRECLPLPEDDDCPERVFSPERLLAFDIPCVSASSQALPEQPDTDRPAAPNSPESDAGGTGKKRLSGKRRAKPDAAAGKETACPPDLSELSPETLDFYHSLPETPFYPDELPGKGFSPARILPALTELELSGCLTLLPGGRYEKK